MTFVFSCSCSIYMYGLGFLFFGIGHWVLVYLEHWDWVGIGVFEYFCTMGVCLHGTR